MTVKITSLADIDAALVEALLDRAFGSDRRGRTAYRLRAGTRPIDALSFAALDGDGALVGTLQSWPVMLAVDNGAVEPLVMVGPVAVVPDQQQGGIGKRLMAALMAAAAGGDPLMMIGDPEYYERFFGFSAAETADWRIDGPVERHRLLAHNPLGRPIARAGRIVPRIDARFACGEQVA